MRIRLPQFVFGGSVLMPLHSAENVASILERQTTELLRAVDTGSSTVRDHYLHSNAVITDENSAVSTKSQMVEQIRPFPPDIAGNLALQDFHVRIAGAAAVATYVIDEHEVLYGHERHCQYPQHRYLGDLLALTIPFFRCVTNGTGSPAARASHPARHTTL